MKKLFLLTLLVWVFIYWWNITNASSSYCETGTIPYGGWTDISNVLTREGDTKGIQKNLITPIESSLNKMWIYSLDYIKDNWIKDNIYNYICKGKFTEKEQAVLVWKIQKYLDNRYLYIDNITKYYIFKNWLSDSKYKDKVNTILWDISFDLYWKRGNWLDDTNWKSEFKTYEKNAITYLAIIKKDIIDKDMKLMLVKKITMSNYCITGNIPLNDSSVSIESVLKEEWDSKKIISKVKAISKNMDNKWVYSLDYIKNNKLTTINKYICKNSLSLDQQNVLVTKLQTYLNERVAYNENLMWFYATKEALSDKKYKDKITNAEMKLRGSKDGEWYTDDKMKKAYQETSDRVNSSFAVIIKMIKSDKDIRWMFWLK